MPNDLRRALAKTNSLKLSVINAIMELEVAAATALARGEDALGKELSLQAALLARESSDIRRAEDKLRGRVGLSGAIAQLDRISGDARRTLRAIRRGADLLDNAAQLLRIIANITAVFP